jgi:hypothetical protein
MKNLTKSQVFMPSRAEMAQRKREETVKVSEEVEEVEIHMAFRLDIGY